jgi:hypothetical protein
VAVALFEKDVNADVISWSFPNLEKEHQEVIKARSGICDDVPVTRTFRFSRFANVWHYILNMPLGESGRTKVSAVTMVVLAKAYNPEKYEALLELFVKMYTASNSPLPVMQAYLSVFSSGKVATKVGEFDDSQFNSRRALISPVKSLIDIFGVEVVVIWVAMLLKKRVFVYCENLDQLLPLVRSFPLVGTWHRQDWDVLRPYCTLSDAEMAELTASGVYVAGFLDAACKDKKDMWDLHVDVPAKAFTIAEHAKNDFLLGRFHQQTGQEFAKSADGQQDQAIIKAIAVKTKELLTNIQSLRSEHDDGTYVTLEELSEKKLPPNMDKFLYNVARVEGFAKK